MYDVFEQHENELNTSYWIPLFHHFISASGAPGKHKIERWVDSADVTDVLTLQRQDELNRWLLTIHGTKQAKWHHFPLSGKHMRDIGDQQSLEHLLDWTKCLGTVDEPSRRIVVHCSAGLHRTGLALYVMFRCVGQTSAQAIDSVRHVRGLTGQELVYKPRRGKRLVDMADERLEQWAGWLG